MLVQIQTMLRPLQEHAAIISVILLGSASAGLQDDTSDVDLQIIYSGKDRPDVRLPDAPWEWDVSYMSLDEWIEYPRKEHWGANAYLTAKIVFDKSGRMGEYIEAICTIPEEQRVNRVAGSLDAYLNAFYRSMKAVRRNNRLGALLQAGASLRHLVFCLFSLNGYIPPYDDRIQVNLHRLKELPLPEETFCRLLVAIAESADAGAQSRLFRAVETLLRKHGFGHVYDAWGNKLNDELKDDSGFPQ